ncbi:MAG TPA: DNA (cytosine-5-)-methyltransferase, partial [Bryobacteraceae bacterium]|nr:DNA (cytosine-5-)-methyltransferase [Bryobacteraceae bacterium]
MKIGSICSGISADSVAWRPLGWRHIWFTEIDPFACAVLKHHYPEVPNYGDFTKATLDRPDVLMASTPCQDFSVAGLRAGMDGARGSLTLRLLDVLGALRPAWLVFENVPGILSADGGRAFGAFLGRLGQLGYGFAYRILDAQHFGVPQRRRRVFVIGHLGDWRPAAAVLFERHSLSGHPPPRREAGQGTTHSLAPSLTGSGRGVERSGESRGQDPVVAIFGGNNTSGPIDVAAGLNAKGGAGRMDFESETFVATG